MKNTIIIIIFLFSFVAFGQKSTLLINGYLHCGNGTVIESAYIGIRNGKIEELKNSLATNIIASEWDTIVDLMGKHVYPGFIAPNSTLGLTEIDAVRATNDFAEVGEYNPHVRSQIAFNVESKVVSTVRTNGVLLAQATPRGNVISGSSSIMALAGWNWEDATILADDGIHLNWPQSVSGGGWWAEPEPKKRNKEYDENKQKIDAFFEMAKAYSENKAAEKDARLEAMMACFQGAKRVYIHANEMQQIIDIIAFAKKFEIKFPVIVGGNDAHLVGQRLKDSNIPIMLTRLHSLPELEEDPIDLPYHLPALLQAQGIVFCLQNEGDMEAMNARNLPFLAGTAMAYGLSEEQAISSISLNAAKIMGIDEQYGSIEKGKIATLFVSEGSVLDMKSSKITHIMYQGKFMETSNFQTELYQKYEQKYK